MKKYFPVLLSLALLYSVGAEATPITYRAELLGSNEDPANASPGTGFAEIVFDADAFTLLVDVAFTGLTGTTQAAHIHCCTTVPFSGNVGVATQTPTFVFFPLGVTAGTYSHLFNLTDSASWNAPFITNNGGTTAGATAALGLGLQQGKAYFNIHTSAFPGGEIRGFLLVPEPSTLGLIALIGIGVLGLATRKRRI